MHNKRRCDRRVDCVLDFVWFGVQKREIRSILNHRDLFDNSPYYTIRKRTFIYPKYTDVSAVSALVSFGSTTMTLAISTYIFLVRKFMETAAGALPAPFV